MAITVGGLLVVCLVGMGDNQASMAEVTAATSPSCSMPNCHTDMSQHSHLHQPVEADLCDVCHEPKENATPYQAGLRHEFKRATDNPELCYECHDYLAEEAYVHQPVRQGLCVLCHDPHGSERAFLLRVDTDRDLCMQCHRTSFDQGDHVHQPAKEGKCLECHKPHGGDFRRLLRGDFTPEPYEPFGLSHYQLCYRCHQLDQVTQPVTTTATDFRNGNINLHFKHVNREEKGRTCNICHEVHTSANPKLIKEQTHFGTWQLPLNFKQTPTGGSCLPGCHRMRGYDRINPVQNE